MRNCFLFLLLCIISWNSKSQQKQEALNDFQDAKVTVLFDAFGKDTNLLKGWGYSILIEYKGKNILFDGGSNANVLQYNFTQKRIDPNTIDIVIVSHTHHDHVNGIDYILKMNPGVKIYFPFDPFWGATNVFDARGQDSLVKDSLPRELRYFDGRADVFPVSQSGGRFWNANIDHVKESKEIIPGVKIIASSAQYMGYFSRYTNSDTQELVHDGCSDLKLTNLTELSLSLATTNGQALFVGCSHSGIDIIAKQTIAETNKPIGLLMGGFHLLPFNRTQTHKVISYLKKDLGIQRVAPGHCTGPLAFKLLKDLYKQDFLFAGLGELILF